jgi:2-dehydro-3-deoxyphosphooctonate aldolase (KDO 8-P synthase)
MQQSVKTVKVREIEIGGPKFTLIAGPCMFESMELCRTVAGHMQDVCNRLGINYIFKASFDKANRTSSDSFRGIGVEEGMTSIAAIKKEFDLPATTDVHEVCQVGEVADVVDLLQIPAFLCRQTDLLKACALTGLPVNIKKGQFLAPWDTKNIVRKMEAFGCEQVLLTERGTSFGYNTLVVDMSGLPIMRSYGYPIVFDATHSVQQPGGAGTASGGNREAIPYLARAAMAVGIDAMFMEVHPEPEKGLSDSASMFPLADVEPLLKQLLAIRSVIQI